MRAFTVARILEKRGFHAYLVGGYVRDSILHIPSNDVDIATNARPEQVEAIFRDNFPVQTVGKSFGVVMVGGVEVATFRSDCYGGLDHKNVQITYADTIEEDLSRRDFTVNAMAIRYKDGSLIDPFNGESDADARIIRFVGNPADRIHEDPNRMLRACRLVAQLNGMLDAETSVAILEHADKIQYVARERMRLEILKAMKVKKASPFFYAMNETGILKYVFPWTLVKCVNHPHGNHHTEDVFIHSMITGDGISTRCPLTKLAGYLHDAGKPETYNAIDESFLNHEEVGEVNVMLELAGLTFSSYENAVVSNLVRLHMRNPSGLSPRGVRRLLSELIKSRVNYTDFLRLYIADRNANLAKDKLTIKEVKEMVSHIEEQLSLDVGLTVKSLKVDGFDVMQVCNMPSGPNVGKILNHLLDMVILDPKLNTREILMTHLEDFKFS